MVDHLSSIEALNSFAERCCYIQELIDDDYPFHLEDQPEAWVQRLIFSKYSIAGITCCYINAMFGGNTICSEASSIGGYPVDLIDSLSMLLDEIQDIEIEDRTHIEKNIIEIIIELRYGRE